MQPSPVEVSVDIPASREDVWNEVARLEDHVEWMADAHRIDFMTDQRRGVGTRMSVATRFGPLRTSDEMEFTAWEEPRRMAVRHEGLFTGSGEFILDALDESTTRFTWRESIRFPWYFGGPLGAWAARPVFTWVWRRNLDRFRERFTSR